MTALSSPPRFHIDRRAPSILEKLRDASDDTLLNTKEVAEWFDVSEQWLENARSHDWGPDFLNLGPRFVRYTVGACRRYLAERTAARAARRATSPKQVEVA